jgi:hypothetical protein
MKTGHGCGSLTSYFRQILNLSGIIRGPVSFTILAGVKDMITVFCEFPQKPIL